MKRKAKSVLTVLLAALMIMTMLPTTAFAASSKKTPAKVSVTKVTASTNAVTVKWKKASNATSYRIYYKQASSKKWIAVANVSSSKTSYTHKNSKKYPLVGGKKYNYRVRAYNKSSKKWGSYSATKTVTIPAVPSTVKMAKVERIANNKVNINWNKASNATSYRVYYKKSGASKWTTLADVSSSKTSYTHTSSKKYPLVSGSKYFYTVRAYNKNSKKWGGYNTKGVSVTIPKKDSEPTSVAITKISFSPIILELKLNVGETYQLKPILAPSNTTQKDLIWSSDHPEAISVDQNGKITILRDGADVVITARSASNSKISGSCEVKSWTGKPIETIKVSKIVCNPSSVSMKVGESKSITTTILPENAEDTYITWESSNPDIADVYDMTMGKAEISAYKAGTATITAHAEDGSNVVGKCTVTVTENVTEATATPTPEPDYYRITFDKNDGSGSVSSLLFKPGTNYSTSRDTETRDGYEFAGWYTEPTGGELVTSFILQKDITLYAHWTKNETGIKGSNLYLEGSETYSCYIAPEDVDSNINISQIEWVVQGNSDIVSISGKGYDSRTGCTDIGFRALRKGQVIIIAKYNGQILRRWTVNVTSDWSNYVGYVNWRKNVESQIWNSNMSVVQKLDATKDYIKTNFKYGTETQPDGYKSYAAVYAWQEGYHFIDCISASELMGDFAKDLNLQVYYVNIRVDKQFEYLVDAVSVSDGHIFNVIIVDGQALTYDAQPPVY